MTSNPFEIKSLNEIEVPFESNVVNSGAMSPTWRSVVSVIYFVIGMVFDGFGISNGL